MILGYFIPKQNFSWEELDLLTEKAKGKWTWPMAGLQHMIRLGFDVKNIEVFNYSRFAIEGIPYLRELYGDEVADAQVKNSDIEKEMERAQCFTISEECIPSIANIHSLLDSGYLIICNVNSHLLHLKTGYAGHFIVVKGYEENNLIIHDPGLPSYENKIINKKTFEQAWAYPNESAKNIMAFKLLS